MSLVWDLIGMGSEANESGASSRARIFFIMEAEAGKLQPGIRCKLLCCTHPCLGLLIHSTATHASTEVTR